MNALNLLLKESKDRTSKEIERLLAKGDVESAKKAAIIISKIRGESYAIFDEDPWFDTVEHPMGKISDNEFIDRINKLYYGGNGQEPLNEFRYKTPLIRQDNHNGKTRWVHADSIPLHTPKKLLEIGKLNAFRNKTRKDVWNVSKLSDEDKKIYDKMRLGKDFGIKKYHGGFSHSNSNEAIERAKKLLEKLTANKNVFKTPKTEQPKTEQPKTEQSEEINNNGNNGNNGNTPKPESEVKTNPVKESFLKKHWGKIGLGVGALGAIGYGAYKYKHRDDNNSYS